MRHFIDGLNGVENAEEFEGNYLSIFMPTG